METKMSPTFINLTPHPITIQLNMVEYAHQTGETEMYTIPPSGKILRVESETLRKSVMKVEEQEWENSYSFRPVWSRETWISVLKPGEIREEDLADYPPQKNTYYIVSYPALAAIYNSRDYNVREREDLLAPDTSKGAIRDTSGQIIGVTGFIKMRKDLKKHYSDPYLRELDQRNRMATEYARTRKMDHDRVHP